MGLYNFWIRSTRDYLHPSSLGLWTTNRHQPWGWRICLWAPGTALTPLFQLWATSGTFGIWHLRMVRVVVDDLCLPCHCLWHPGPLPTPSVGPCEGRSPGMTTSVSPSEFSRLLLHKINDPFFQCPLLPSTHVEMPCCLWPVSGHAGKRWENFALVGCFFTPSTGVLLVLPTGGKVWKAEMQSTLKETPFHKCSDYELHHRLRHTAHHQLQKVNAGQLENEVLFAFSLPGKWIILAFVVIIHEAQEQPLNILGSQCSRVAR